MKDERIGLELRSLNNMIRRYFEFSPHRKEIDSATGSNGWIIGYLANNSHREIFQKDIEENFTITRSTASKVLSLMEQKGLIQRQAVSQDARLKRIVLTQKAWGIREIMLEDANALEHTLIGNFLPGEVDTLRSYLKRMKENLSASQEKNRGELHD